MNTIAIDEAEAFGGILRNRTPDQNPVGWAEGLWCRSTLGPEIHVRVGWDGLINRAYNNDDPEPSGHWIAE